MLGIREQQLSAAFIQIFSPKFLSFNAEVLPNPCYLLFILQNFIEFMNSDCMRNCFHIGCMWWSYSALQTVELKSLLLIPQRVFRSVLKGMLLEVTFSALLTNINQELHHTTIKPLWRITVGLSYIHIVQFKTNNDPCWGCPLLLSSLQEPCILQRTTSSYLKSSFWWNVLGYDMIRDIKQQPPYSRKYQMNPESLQSWRNWSHTPYSICPSMIDNAKLSASCPPSTHINPCP